MLALALERGARSYKFAASGEELDELWAGACTRPLFSST
jgi:hypothetical protein